MTVQTWNTKYSKTFKIKQILKSRSADSPLLSFNKRTFGYDRKRETKYRLHRMLSEESVPERIGPMKRYNHILYIWNSGLCRWTLVFNLDMKTTFYCSFYVRSNILWCRCFVLIGEPRWTACLRRRLELVTISSESQLLMLTPCLSE